MYRSHKSLFLVFSASFLINRTTRSWRRVRCVPRSTPLWKNSKLRRRSSPVADPHLKGQYRRDFWTRDYRQRRNLSPILLWPQQVRRRSASKTQKRYLKKAVGHLTHIRILLPVVGRRAI